MIESHLLSIGGKPDDQANDEDEDEDNKALSKSPTDDQVVPAHIRRPLGLHVLVQHLLGQGLLGKVLLVEDLFGEDLGISLASSKLAAANQEGERLLWCCGLLPPSISCLSH